MSFYNQVVIIFLYFLDINPLSDNMIYKSFVGCLSAITSFFSLFLLIFIHRNGLLGCCHDSFNDIIIILLPTSYHIHSPEHLLGSSLNYQDAVVSMLSCSCLPGTYNLGRGKDLNQSLRYGFTAKNYHLDHLICF